MTEIRDTRRHAFFIIDNEVIRHYTPVIGVHAFAVYCCLVAHASHSEHACVMRMKTIADRAGVSVRTVQRAIATLSGEDGVLDTAGLAPLVAVETRRLEGGFKTASRYLILHVIKDADEAGPTVAPDRPESPIGSAHESGQTGPTDRTEQPARPSNNNTLSNQTSENKTTPLTPQGGGGEENAASQSAITTGRSTLASRFERFWAVYPKKVGKAEALRRWEKLRPDEQMTGRIVEAVTAQAQSDQWRKEGGQYIPNPTTWLNRGGWEDQPAIELPGAIDTTPAYARNEYGFNPVTFLARIGTPATAEEVARLEAGEKVKDVLSLSQTLACRNEFRRLRDIALGVADGY